MVHAAVAGFTSLARLTRPLVSRLGVPYPARLSLVSSVELVERSDVLRRRIIARTDALEYRTRLLEALG